MRASVTGSPAPSMTRPVIAIAPALPSGTTNGPSGHGSPIARNGPTVCEGVSALLAPTPPPPPVLAPTPPPHPTLPLHSPAPRTRPFGPGAPYPRRNRATTPAPAGPA